MQSLSTGQSPLKTGEAIRDGEIGLHAVAGRHGFEA
jgi:hypothetical protein